MTGFEIGLWSFVALLILIVIRSPIGLAMFICGVVGTYFVVGSWDVPLNRLKTEVYSQFSGYSLSIIPLFILMGQFATVSGMSARLFKAGEVWLGHWKGGLAMASIGACAGFGSICGSSLATAATMGKTALPEMRRYGYAGGFSTATIAAGGTLGILIPPSVILVIYAIITEQNIAKLFLAAFVPGILAAIGYMVTIAIYVRIYPDRAGTTRPPQPMSERIKSLIDVLPVMGVFVIVVGGIYGGIFSPTDAASVGAILMFILALRSGEMRWSVFKKAVMETAISTAMIFFIILGASIYNGFLALTQVPQELAAWIVGQGLSPWVVLWIILIFYLILGCLMDSLSMILLTVPIFFPIITGLDFGLTFEQTAIWFGILVLIVVEVGLITPPVGMILFIINSLERDTPIVETYKAVMFYVASDLFRVILLVSFPIITVFLI